MPASHQGRHSWPPGHGLGPRRDRQRDSGLGRHRPPTVGGPFHLCSPAPRLRNGMTIVLPQRSQRDRCGWHEGRAAAGHSAVPRAAATAPLSPGPQPPLRCPQGRGRPLPRPQHEAPRAGGTNAGKARPGEKLNSCEVWGLRDSRFLAVKAPWLAPCPPRICGSPDSTGSVSLTSWLVSVWVWGQRQTLCRVQASCCIRGRGQGHSKSVPLNPCRRKVKDEVLADSSNLT